MMSASEPAKCRTEHLWWNDNKTVTERVSWDNLRHGNGYVIMWCGRARTQVVTSSRAKSKRNPVILHNQLLIARGCR